MMLETDRFYLRPLAPEHAPSIRLLAGDEAVSATALGIPYPLTEQDADEWVQEAQQGLAAGREYTFALIEKASGAPPGVRATPPGPLRGPDLLRHPAV